MIELRKICLQMLKEFLPLNENLRIFGELKN